MAQQNQDERIAKRSSLEDIRADRSASDRKTTENRETTDNLRLEERLAILRDVNTKLPQAPEIPGFHTCWLTTTNQSDSLEYRARLGYELVKPEELPGFAAPVSQQMGQVATDRIMVNEMVLAKIPKELAAAYLHHVHHELPTQQMEQLRQSVQITRDGRGREVAYTGSDRDGDFRSGVSDGFRTLQKTSRPSFEGVL